MSAMPEEEERYCTVSDWKLSKMSDIQSRLFPLLLMREPESHCVHKQTHTRAHTHTHMHLERVLGKMSENLQTTEMDTNGILWESI